MMMAPPSTKPNAESEIQLRFGLKFTTASLEIVQSHRGRLSQGDRCDRPDLNQRPPDLQSGTLPAELLSQ